MINMQAFQSFMQNPRQFMPNMPQNIRTPQDIIQHLMDTGKLSQADYANLQAQARQIQENPLFQQFLRK